jgi:hypothetical protein
MRQLEKKGKPNGAFSQVSPKECTTHPLVTHKAPAIHPHAIVYRDEIEFTLAILQE